MNLPAEIEDLLKQLVAHAAKNARDETFKQEDIISMAENMAKSYGIELLALLDKSVEEETDRIAKNALVIAEYWLEEDGRPKHLIQDLWDVKDISVLDHIDQKYIERYFPKNKQRQTWNKIKGGEV